jgi:hypothetical protein
MPDNASVSVSDTGWKPAAMKVEQLPPSPKFATITISPGTGAMVKPGELVKILVADDRRAADDKYQQVAWVWTGYLPDELVRHGGTSPSILGGMLVGRPIGEQFHLELVEKYESLTIEQFGIAEPNKNRRGAGSIETFKELGRPLTLADATGNSAYGSNIQIVTSCPVRPSIRDGVMTQWGHIFNMYGTGYVTDRRANLYWSAIDADCPEPDNKVRFMVGPSYSFPLQDGNTMPRNEEMLYNWQAAYREERSEILHPEEYRYISINGKQVHADSR